MPKPAKYKPRLFTFVLFIDTHIYVHTNIEIRDAAVNQSNKTYKARKRRYPQLNAAKKKASVFKTCAASYLKKWSIHICKLCYVDISN